MQNQVILVARPNDYFQGMTMVIEVNRPIHSGIAAKKKRRQNVGASHERAEHRANCESGDESRAQTNNSDHEYCLTFTRQHDRTRFLCALFAPEAERQRLLAVLALLAELHQAMQQISEPMLGMVRLQWWREAADSIFSDTPVAHPVIRALHAAHQAQPFTRQALLAPIEARERDLAETGFTDMEAVYRYARQRSGMAVLLEALGQNKYLPVMQPLAEAWGLFDIAATLPAQSETSTGLQLPAREDGKTINMQDAYRQLAEKQWRAWRQQPSLDRAARKKLWPLVLWETPLRSGLNRLEKNKPVYTDYRPAVSLRLLLRSLLFG